MAFPTLPTPAPERATEGTLGHGLRILAFMLEHNVTATLTDLELERAEYAAAFAVTAREILPIAVDKISNLRHLIHKVLQSRKAYADAVTCDTPSDPDVRPPAGPMARLQPQPIRRPPSGDLIEIGAPGKPEIRF